MGEPLCACGCGKAIRPKRPHRRARIRKKWLRRYGWVLKCDGHGYQMAGVGLVGCPHFVAKIRKAVASDAAVEASP